MGAQDRAEPTALVVNTSVMDRIALLNVQTPDIYPRMVLVNHVTITVTVVVLALKTRSEKEVVTLARKPY